MPQETPFIPVIDASAMRGPAGPALEALGAELRNAFTTSGFCYITHHGLDAAVIAAAADEALEFFHRPLAEKQKAAPKEAVRGFNAIGRTTMRGAKNPDYKEYFQIGLELPRDDPAVLAGQPLRGPNQWPEDAPGFRDALTRYFDAVADCGHALLRAIAVSLGAAPDAFVDKYHKPLQRTQCVYYPPHPAGMEDTFGVAPHTDYGCVTLLWQDDVGGLEVAHPSGGWTLAPPIPGSLVVNVGDLLARWSNERYRSTWHRVTNRSGRERLSIVTFHDPDHDAVVDPADLGLGSGARRRHEPVLAGEYIMGRINASQQPHPAPRVTASRG
jgi:isopenicillin N synthase-like dioxygenase